ncbi:DoxX family protein [Arcobacter sp. YIC-310]|uniref:DoxX family protein n=1 Tax=Arcobacter sp. YIC-310 TaxID=3376632 RepID=UPI003C240435
MFELLFNKKRVFEDLALLLLRLFMGGTFLVYAIKKVQGFDNYVVLFSDKLDLPFPMINLYLVMAVEGIGGILLVLGVLTRFISIPLIFTMVVAFFLVNINNGFAASNFGVEVPLAYISILIVLFAFGSGKISVDDKLLKNK